MVTNPAQARFDWDGAAQLNPRYTFDAFVIGSGTNSRMQPAWRWRSVFESVQPTLPLRRRGMGKTHLMQALDTK